MVVVIVGLTASFLINTKSTSLQTILNFEQASDIDGNITNDYLYTSYWGDSVIRESLFVDSIAYLACGENGLTILNISNPHIPQLIITIRYDNFSFNDFVLSDNILYCYNETIIYLFNIATPETPSYITNYTIFHRLYGLNVKEKIGYLSCRNLTSTDELQILNLTNPENITRINSFHYSNHQIYFDPNIIEISEEFMILSEESQTAFLNLSDLMNIFTIKTLSNYYVHFFATNKLLLLEYLSEDYTITCTNISVYDKNNIIDMTLISSLSVNYYLSFNYQKNNQLFFSGIMEYDSYQEYNDWYRISGYFLTCYIYQLDGNNCLSMNRTVHFNKIPEGSLFASRLYNIDETFRHTENTIYVFDEIIYIIEGKYHFSTTLGSRLYVSYVDIDRDGLHSFLEDTLGLSVTEPDTDNDLLDDGLEYYVYRTNPGVSDTDGDGYSDNEEIYRWGTNPLSNIDKPSIEDLEQYYNINTRDVILYISSIIGIIAIIVYLAILNHNSTRKNQKIFLMLISRFVFLALFLGAAIPFICQQVIYSVAENYSSTTSIFLSGAWTEYYSGFTFTGFASELGSFNSNIPLFAFLSIGFFFGVFLIEVIFVPINILKEQVIKQKTGVEITLLVKNGLLFLSILFGFLCLFSLFSFFNEIEKGVQSVLDPLFSSYFTLNWTVWFFLCVQVFSMLYLFTQLTSFDISRAIFSRKETVSHSLFRMNKTLSSLKKRLHMGLTLNLIRSFLLSSIVPLTLIISNFILFDSVSLNPKSSIPFFIILSLFPVFYLISYLFNICKYYTNKNIAVSKLDKVLSKTINDGNYRFVYAFWHWRMILVVLTEIDNEKATKIIAEKLSSSTIKKDSLTSAFLEKVQEIINK